MAFDPTYKTSAAPNGPMSIEDKHASWVQQQGAYQTGLDALGNEIGQAQKTGDIWSNIQKAGEAQTQQGMSALRKQAATNLYANRGSLGGGGGLAGLQQAQSKSAADLTAATTQANAQRAQLADQAQQAQLGAQQQIAQAAGQRYKMMQEQGQRQVRVNQAVDLARQIMQRNAGTIYTTANDKKKAIDQIRSEVLSVETDPAVQQAVENYIAALKSGEEDVPNTIG